MRRLTAVACVRIAGDQQRAPGVDSHRTRHVRHGVERSGNRRRRNILQRYRYDVQHGRRAGGRVDDTLLSLAELPARRGRHAASVAHRACARPVGQQHDDHDSDDARRHANWPLLHLANADDGAAVAETSEGNNIRYVQIRVGPDLTVTGISGPARGGVGDTILVNDTTKNSGSGNAGPSTTVFYLSANYALDAGDTRLTPTRSVGPLNAGDPSSGSTSIVVPAVTPGLWYLIANADDGDAVMETTETNNTAVHDYPDRT